MHGCFLRLSLGAFFLVVSRVPGNAVHDKKVETRESLAAAIQEKGKPLKKTLVFSKANSHCHGQCSLSTLYKEEF